MQPDSAAAALAIWQAARSEQIDVERQLERVRRHGPRAKLAELLVLLEKVEVRAALLLAHAVKVRLACDDGNSDHLTSTLMGLPSDLRDR
jgi:GAF domain-containing protein